ncbi:MAG: tol-pal system protein YbgF [Candidatus Hydrogenedentes bacterium ADurb.Bin101]|jgi:TolA-binding protein|nr:MAG: tol-pal system protein YbgF [Candidatus Hydrogenedentes bacterium ADurb.Bin101]
MAVFSYFQRWERIRSARAPFPPGAFPLVLALFISLSIAHAAKAQSGNQLDFANGLFHRGFYKEAIAEYEGYLSNAPEGEDAATAWLRLGRSAVAIEDYARALEAFRKAEAATTDAGRRVEARVSAGEALFFSGKYPETIETLKDLSGTATPEEPRARVLYYLGRSFIETGAYAEAVSSFSSLIADVPETPLAGFAQYHLGFAHLAGNALEEAAKAFSAAAKAPGGEDALRMESCFRAAELYDKLGWTETALTAYEQLRKDYPESEYARRADYGYGWALYHSGRYEDADALAAAFVKNYPDSAHLPGFLYLRGNCRYQQARYAKALEHYDALRSRYPDSPFAERALYKSAWAHYLSGDNAAASKEVAAFLETYPESELRGEGLYLLGSLHVAEGNYETALTEFRQVSENYSGSEFAAEALFKAAECHALLGTRDEAAKTFEAFARAYPDNPLTEQAMMRSGDARFTAQDFAAALANYKGILEKPGDPAVEEEALYRLAVTYHNMKEQSESAAAFRRLLEKFPDGKYAAEALLRIGDFELRQNKDALKAIEAYQAVLAQKPAENITLGALQGLATARYEQKDYEQAAAQVLQLIQNYPDNPLPPDAYMWCGQWLQEVERWKDAAAVFAALLKAHPEHEQRGELLFVLGGCYEKSGDIDQAVTAYTDLLHQDADPVRGAELRLRLGKLQESRKALEEARVLYEEAANLDGGEFSARARFQLAALYESGGDYENAARNFMRLAILYIHETLSPEALWHAGNCYTRMNKPDQARSVFEELVADYPDSPFAKEAQALLDQQKNIAPSKTE